MKKEAAMAKIAMSRNEKSLLKKIRKILNGDFFLAVHVWTHTISVYKTFQKNSIFS